MNRGSQYLRGKEGMLKVMKEERREPKEIGRYVDEKTGVTVKVYSGPEERSFKTVPTGYEV